jgi:Amt family ammonium transporter
LPSSPWYILPTFQPATTHLRCSNGFAFGENRNGTSNPFIGSGDFALSNTKTNTRSDSSWHLFFFHWAFSAAAATIVAGAVAERIAFECYMGYTCLMTSFVSG